MTTTSGAQSSAPSAAAGWAGRLRARWGFVHSVKFKILCIFLPSFLLALGPMGYTYWRDAKAAHIRNLTTKLELIADYTIPRVDAASLLTLNNPARTGTPAHLALVQVLRQAQDEFKVDNVIVLRLAEDGAFRYLGDGNNQFTVYEDVMVHRRFPQTEVAARAAWSRRGEGHTQLFGFGEFEYLQFNKAIEHQGEVVALLMLNIFAEDVDQAIRSDTTQLILLSLSILLGGSVVFWVFFSRVIAPLTGLKAAANQVARGELEVDIPSLRGRDEIALLNESFRSMVRDLRANRSELEDKNRELTRTLAKVQIMEDVEKNLSKFLPHSVRTVLNSDPEALERDKTEKDVTVLFLDVEGSTQHTESKSATRIDHLIEEYFSRYLDYIYENQGDITETAGDGLMIIFQGDNPGVHALNAVNTAAAIQRVTREIHAGLKNPDEALRINIGINSGKALVGFTRYEGVSGTRITFTASGRTTILAARLQDQAKQGSILVSGETLRRVRSHPVFREHGLRVEAMGRLMLKNMNDPEPVFRLHAEG